MSSTESESTPSLPRREKIRRSSLRAPVDTRLPEVVTPLPDSSSTPTDESPLRLDELFPAYAGKAYEQQALIKRDLLIEEVRHAYLGEGLALYVGAGVSMSVGLPSWAELINSLTVTMMSRRVKSAAETLQTLSEEERAAALKALLDAVKEQKPSQKPILMMARSIKDQLGAELPLQVAANLYGSLFPTTEDFFSWLKRLFSFGSQTEAGIPAEAPFKLPSSPLLEALVALVRPQRNVVGVQAIINYNYDDILEERLRRESVPCLTVLSGKQRLTRGKIPSYHVHGALPLQKYLEARHNSKQIDIGNFVFSEDEYHLEYADPYRWSNLTQISMLGRHKGIFVGLSMQDPNLRRLIDVTHRQYPEIWNYAILQRAAKEPGSDDRTVMLQNLAEFVEEDSFLKIGVKVLWVNDIRRDIAPLLRKVARLPDE